MGKMFKCVYDRQLTDWYVGEVNTIEGWRETAIEWCEMDDNDDVAEYLSVLRADKVLGFISETWDIEFEEVKGEE